MVWNFFKEFWYTLRGNWYASKRLRTRNRTPESSLGSKGIYASFGHLGSYCHLDMAPSTYSYSWFTNNLWSLAVYFFRCNSTRWTPRRRSWSSAQHAHCLYESNLSISVLEYELPSWTSLIPGRSVLLFARLTYRVAAIPSRAVAFVLKRLQRNLHNFTKAKEWPASRNYEQKRTCGCEVNIQRCNLPNPSQRLHFIWFRKLMRHWRRDNAKGRTWRQFSFTL